LKNLGILLSGRGSNFVAIADSIATTFDDGKAVESKKALGIKLGIVSLGLATVLGTLDILLIIYAGGSR